MAYQVPPKICLLITVWGDTYIQDFLNVSLPSLLAPGNIPALCETYETKVTILTTFHQIPILTHHPIFQKLQAICHIEFIEIDDLTLIFETSIVITKSYERGIKNLGQAALNTYCIFLVADYIMANGSMQGLLHYIRQGYSGIYAANFQIVKEKALPFFQDLLEKGTGILNISPRDLLRFSFKNIHPIVKASIYHQTILTNPYINRFYFPGRNQLIMRGYLLHMLCIKPETLDDEIMSACDYSFMPTLCPSGNTAIITDSDEYLVVEIQSIKHEIDLMHLGQATPEKLATYLSKWTTTAHRKNALTSLFFHTETLTHEEKNNINHIATQFIEKIHTHLNHYPPQSITHAYWRGVDKKIQEMDFFKQQIRAKSYFDIRSFRYQTRWQKLFQTWSGQTPNFNFWHPRWYEHFRLKIFLKQYFKNVPSSEKLILYEAYNPYLMGFYTWFKETMDVTQQYHLSNLNVDILANLNIKKCLLFYLPKNFSSLQAHIDKIFQQAKSLEVLDVIIFNPFIRPFDLNYNFKIDTYHQVNQWLPLNFYISDIYSLKNSLPFISSSIKHKIIKLTRLHRAIKFALFLICIGIGMFMSIFVNTLQYMLGMNKGSDTHLIISIKSYLK